MKEQLYNDILCTIIENGRVTRKPLQYEMMSGPYIGMIVPDGHTFPEEEEGQGDMGWESKELPACYYEDSIRAEAYYEAKSRGLSEDEIAGAIAFALNHCGELA